MHQIRAMGIPARRIVTRSVSFEVAQFRDIEFDCLSTRQGFQQVAGG